MEDRSMTLLSMNLKLLIMIMNIRLHSNKKDILTQLQDKQDHMLDLIMVVSLNGVINKINGPHFLLLK